MPQACLFSADGSLCGFRQAAQNTPAQQLKAGVKRMHQRPFALGVNVSRRHNSVVYRHAPSAAWVCRQPLSVLATAMPCCQCLCQRQVAVLCTRLFLAFGCRLIIRPSHPAEIEQMASSLCSVACGSLGCSPCGRHHSSGSAVPWGAGGEQLRTCAQPGVACSMACSPCGRHHSSGSAIPQGAGG